MLYNPALALATLEAAGGSRAFFDKWFAAMKEDKGLPRVHDKKLSILTLCELLKMDVNAVPPSLKDGWGGLVGGILDVFKALPDAEIRKYFTLALDLVLGGTDHAKCLGRSEMLEDFDDESGSDEEDMDEDFDDGEGSAGVLSGSFPIEAHVLTFAFIQTTRTVMYSMTRRHISTCWPKR